MLPNCAREAMRHFLIALLYHVSAVIPVFLHFQCLLLSISSTYRVYGLFMNRSWQISLITIVLMSSKQWNASLKKLFNSTTIFVLVRNPMVPQESWSSEPCATIALRCLSSFPFFLQFTSFVRNLQNLVAEMSSVYRLIFSSVHYITLSYSL